MSINNQSIIDAWKAVFPNSHCSVTTVLDSTCFAGRIQNQGEWINDIPQNDPLTYRGWIRGDDFEESNLHLLVKPKLPYMVYGSEKMRKQTIKNVDYNKLVKRFTKIKEWIASHKDNMAHNIEGKV